MYVLCSAGMCMWDNACMHVRIRERGCVFGCVYCSSSRDAYMASPKQWLAVDESAKSLLARVLSRRIPPLTSVPPLHRVPLHSGHVLEIVGPSGSAKSELLIQAAVACILPKQVDGVVYGGTEGVVLMIDLDCHFDMLRLVNVLQIRINEAREAQHGGLTTLLQGSREGDGEDEVFIGCLKRFCYICCNSSFDFLAALKTLHAKIRRFCSIDMNPQMIMIDSINAFYWIDRAISSVTSAGPGGGRTALSLQVVSEAVVQELKRILQTYPVLILATKSLIYNLNFHQRKFVESAKDGLQREGTEGNLEKSGECTTLNDGKAMRDFMPAIWQGFVTHRLILQGPFQTEGGQQLSEEVPFFTADWEIPCLQQTDKFVIEDRGVRLKE